MSDFPGSPRILKGGIVLLDPDTGAVLRVIALQYNPDSLTRTLQVAGSSAEGSDRGEALRLKGPPVETFRLEAEIDATDELEQPDRHPAALELGVAHKLAALETVVYPTARSISSATALAATGAIEIMPAAGPLTLFVWSRRRIMPVRLTELSVVEEAFDVDLNPIRARVTIGMRVLSVDDLAPGSHAANLYMVYQQQKESLAARDGGALSMMGLGGIPHG